jgi:D-ribose pyranase
VLRKGILNPTLNRILSETGHTDMLTICDRGFPVPLDVERLDLVLVDDIPTVIDVLTAINKQFVIDRIIIANEMVDFSLERAIYLHENFRHIKFEKISYLEFRELCKMSRAVIRTGDTVLYANIIIISG